MFADDICVFCRSVRGLQRILDVCQAYAESREIIFTGCTRLKAISHYKHLGFVLDIELSDDKDILSQLRNINIV